MKDDEQTREQLIAELTKLRSQNAALNKSVTGDISAELAAEEGKNRVQSWQEGINRILGLVLEAVPFDEKLKCITDGVVETFGADFCRIWIIGKGDLCSAGCMHAEAWEGPHVCQYRDKCLCLKASSGRYTHIDGKVHRRVPFGAYKIGRIASGEEIRFLTNDVRHDPRVHDQDQEWAKSLGLAAFAGYRLRPTGGETLGVLALFAKFEISPEMDATLEGLSRAVSLVIQKDIAERALIESEEKLIRIQKAIESSSDAIGMANPQGSHFYQNKAFLDLFGYSIAELNKPLAPVVTYADPEVGREVFATIMQGAPWVGETIMMAKSGRQFPVFLRADAVKDDHGAIIGLIGIHTDITERKSAEEKLNNQMSLISTLLDTIPSPIFYKDTTGKYLGCNRAFEEIMGKSREEVVGKDIYELYPPEITDLYAEKDRELYEHPGSQIYEGKFNTADGKVRDVIISKATYTDAGKNIAGVVGIFIDITERKQAEQRLSEEVALKNFLLDLFKKASALTDKDLYDYVLDYVVQITGSAIGFFHLVSDDQLNVILTVWNTEALRNCTAAYATHYPLEQAGNWVDCVRLRRPVVYNDFPSSPNRKGLPEGHTPVSRFMSVPVVEGDKVRIIFGVGNKSAEYHELDAIRIEVVASYLQRIMAQRRAEEEIRTLSITDQLTGLHNRRGFITFADQQLKLSDRTKRVMLLFFTDLDGMKWINDTFGHEEGDRALMDVAAILKETFRSVDIIARMGGDEFAILAIDSTEANSEIFSTRLQERIDAHNQQENRSYCISLSVGCACYNPENSCSLDELIVRADKLMYEHKRIKENPVFHLRVIRNGETL